MSPDLPVSQPGDPDDDGSPSTALRHALRTQQIGRGHANEVLTALAHARLLVPIVAVLEEAMIDASGLPHEKQSSMATVLVESVAGQRSLLAFTGMDSMRQWRADARPAPLASPLAARAAIEEKASLYIDSAGPVPFVLAESELLMLASLARPAAAGQEHDPVLHEAIRRQLCSRRWPQRAYLRATPEEPTTVSVIGDATAADREGLFRDLAADPVVSRLLGRFRLGVTADTIPGPGAGAEVFRREPG